MTEILGKSRCEIWSITSSESSNTGSKLQYL